MMSSFSVTGATAVFGFSPMKLTSLSVAVLAATLTLTTMARLHANPSKAGWTQDESAALAKAKADKKMVLLDFTGSDWCSWCQKMDKEVFDTPEFKDYAKDHLELVEVDYPNQKPLAAATLKQNAELKQQYHIEGFPTLVVLDGNGTTVKVLEGYQPGGAKAFVETLKKLKG